MIPTVKKFCTDESAGLFRMYSISGRREDSLICSVIQRIVLYGLDTLDYLVRIGTRLGRLLVWRRSPARSTELWDRSVPKILAGQQ